MTDLLQQLPAPPPGRVGWPWTEETHPTNHDGQTAWPRISLVTPSYQQGEFIEETIRSILLQNYPNLQYTVIDGGSTDGSMAIIRKYEKWIDHWVSEPDRGQSDAINKGLTLADGQWFNWINSDDYLMPGALHALAAATLDDPELVCVSGETINLRDGELFGPYRTITGDDTADGVFGQSVNQPGSLLRLDAVRALGGLRSDLRYVMDFELWLRLRIVHGTRSFRSLPERVAVYRYHSASKTCSEDDVFAGEQLTILTQFAQSRGARFPASVIALADGSAPAVGFFATVSDHWLPASAAEAAWIKRTVVSDSLLFRALRQMHRNDRTVLAAFEELLSDLTPLLERHCNSRPAAVMGKAMLDAMEIMGQLPLRGALRSLALNPDWRQLRGLTGLALRRFP